MPFTFNGIGTTYYGNRDTGPDGSYVTTEWFVFVYIPVIPIRSVRVLRTKEATNAIVYNSQGYLAQPVPFCWAQIRNVYLIVGVIVAIIVGIIAAQ